MVSLQSAGIDQIPIIQKIAKVTWPITFREILSKKQLKYMLEMMYSSSSLTDQMETHHHRFLLAIENGKVLGFTSFEIGFDGKTSLKIHKLYLLPEAQGKGIGKIMLQQIGEVGLKNQSTHMILNVNRYNHKAIQFYEKWGFKIIGEELIPIGAGYVMDDYIMDKPL
ncbi:MAG: GNAT family N-acetyltransferase [Cyclobacteriaceae bacterium]